VLGSLVALVMLSTAQRCHEAPPAEEPLSETRPIEVVLAERTPGWMAVPGVVGTGQGLCDGVPCIVIYASARTPEIEARIPATAEGHPVRVEVTGRIEPLAPGDSGP